MRHGFITTCLLLGACEQAERDSFRLDAVCIEGEEPADGPWECSEPLVVDCNDAPVPDEIFVRVGAGECADLDLQGVAGPFPVGQHDIVIVDGNTDTAVCSTVLTVTDTLAPFIETAQMSLWPPNHDYEQVALDECIVSVVECDDTWTATIEFVSSDEAVDDQGDGNTSADILIVASDAVNLRRERAGGGNGRVYTIGFTVTDGAGNPTFAECRVVVDHDRGHGGAIDDGEAYRVEA